MDGDDNARRTSSRTNKGVPPSWFGQRVDEPSKRKNRGSTSAKSAKSTRLATAKASLQADEEIAILSEELANKKLNLDLLVSDIGNESSNLETLQQQLADATSEDEKTRLNAEIQDKKTTIDAMKNDLRTAEIKFTTEKKIIEDKIALIRRRADVEVLSIQDEAENESLSSEEDPTSTVRHRTTEWATETARWNREQEPSVMSVDYGFSNPRERNPGHNSPVMTLPNGDNSIELARFVIDKAMRFVRDESNSNRDRVLARQLHGKDLPIFSGRPEDWPPFIMAYRSSNESCQYNDDENLARLRRCLKGEALSAVQGLMTSAANVSSILYKLKSCFGRPEHIIECMVKKLRNVPIVKHDKFESLVKLGNEVDNLVSTIKALRVEIHLHNPTLLRELEEKLPNSLKLQWAKSKLLVSSNQCTLETFQRWLSAEAEAAVTLCDYGRSADRKELRKEERIYATSSRRSKRKGKCPFCFEESHKAPVCPKLLNGNVEERWKLAREARVCFSCLNYGHAFKDCRSRRSCGKDKCAKEHHQLLHNQAGVPPKEVVTQEVNHAQNSSPVNLMILPVKIRGPGGVVSTYAMMDNGSTITMVDSQIAQAAGLKGENSTMTISGFQSEPVLISSKSVELEIMSVDEKFKYAIRKAQTVENLQLKRQSLRKGCVQKWPHLQGLPILTYTDQQPKILIGSDNPKLMRQLDFRSGRRNSPVAVKTHLGWVVQGQLSWSRHNSIYHVFSAEEELHEIVKQSFQLERYGSSLDEKLVQSSEDKLAVKIMESTTRKISDGYEIGLLWRNEQPHLPTEESYKQAYRRLCLMEKKMDKDSKFKEAYQAKIDEYVSKGFANVLTEEEAKNPTPKTFYVPHFMHVNPKKPGKFRFVFDAAAKVSGKSLNDYLLQGPDYLVSLPSVLLKFRKKAIGISADIKDMFHRVKVREEDRPAQRFLWRGENKSQPPTVLQMNVLIFGATCSPCCASYVKNLNARGFSEKFPKATTAILEKHYVDDYLDCADSMEEAVDLFYKVRQIHANASFNLCNWSSNCNEFLEKINPELLASTKQMNLNHEQVERVLGLYWDTRTDSFIFPLNLLRCKSDIINGTCIPTKREVLSLSMSVFDPLGLISKLTIKSRIILQRLWNDKLNWDDKISEERFIEWCKWLKHLKSIDKFVLPRCYTPSLSCAEDVQLHVFCDASPEAFGSVAYLRVSKGQSVRVSLVMSRSKVSPLKRQSIPRLELQAAIVGVRLSKFICDNQGINFHSIHYWTDSKTVLSWIASSSNRFKEFVANRVGEIQEQSSTAQWRWVPTVDNVADEMTRFEGNCDLGQTSRWVRGPEFLQFDPKLWPIDNSDKCIDEQACEIKREFCCIAERQPEVIEFERFSKFTTLVRSVAYVLRFLVCSKQRATGALLCVELKNAEKKLIQIVQRIAYGTNPTEVDNRLADAKDLNGLQPILIDGILRARGRLVNSQLSFETKHPIILPSKHKFTNLLIMKFHVDCNHHGYERIVNEIRQQYYIPRLRSRVRKIHYECQTCKNKKAAPVVPMMGDLPAVRTSTKFVPFLNTGMDYFGPIEVTVKRSREKRYGVLFTCLASRAVHLEIAHSLTTDSCIQAIRRFVSRRGCPENIYSDNGTNLVGANNELKSSVTALSNDRLQTSCAGKGIAWHFIPPSAPHMGGSWERMVKSVKTALDETIMQRSLNDELLLTLFAEAEHTVNSHPLTHVSTDPSDPEALSPNHFLIGKSSNTQPWGVFEKADLIGRRHWKATQHLANHFWRRWIKEYLPTLLRREKWNLHRSPIRVGDIVIEVNPNLPRNSWPKTVVEKLYPGKDGIVRVVDVRSHSGAVYKRPVAKLCVLDTLDKE